MTSNSMKLPSPDHPITIEANPSRVVVLIGGRVIADSMTRNAHVLCIAPMMDRNDSFSISIG